jgi:AmiR/NasT family two-component response regulator
VLASFVTVALVASEQRDTAESLRAGLHSNREIGKAMGLMMAFHKISDEEAFTMLRRASQDMNIKLSEVARRVVEHHNKA